MYQDKAGFDHATRVNDLLKKGGLERKAVTVEEMKSIEPALQGELYGGYYTQSDSTGDIHKYTRGLAKACVEQGAEFIYDASVLKIQREQGRVHLEFTQAGSGSH